MGQAGGHSEAEGGGEESVGVDCEAGEGGEDGGREDL